MTAIAETESPLARLSEEQLEDLGREFDAIHDEVYEDLGDRDRRYIVAMIELHRRLAVLARVLLLGARFKPAWIAGTTANSMAKILENMELGHNILHGQWDWMNDPQIHSTSWDWDTASTSEAWKHSHNYVHHTYTNIRGKDRDLGYEIMRIDPHQRWHPVYLAQPLYNLLLMAFFEWGVATHDLDFEAIRSGEKPKEKVLEELKGMAGKARTQITKDYIAWPLISGIAMTLIELGLITLKARANGGERNPAVRATRTLRRFRRKQRGRREVLRQLVERRSFQEPFRRTLTADVAANINGGPFFHVMSGNLGYQVEHHLYPDMPSSRYGEIAPRVREICKRYGLPYNSGPFHQQLGMVQRTILRLGFPGGKPRPKPGAYEGPLRRGKGERPVEEQTAAAG